MPKRFGMSEAESVMFLPRSSAAGLPSGRNLNRKFHLQSGQNTRLTIKATAKYSLDRQAGPVRTVSIPARLNMSRASSQPATSHADFIPATADFIPATKDWLSITDTVAA
jgi:hypothetical protein